MILASELSNLPTAFLSPLEGKYQRQQEKNLLSVLMNPELLILRKVRYALNEHLGGSWAAQSLSVQCLGFTPHSKKTATEKYLSLRKVLREGL